jgi:hypothetical protein
MASRKTYFGIGLPKDPTDPQPPIDAADQSQPTVVDDEKVAEGLKQLRSWYQEVSHEEDTRRVVAPPVQGSPSQPSPVAPVQTAPVAVVAQARPTAVGHATGETPPPAQRPIAPDPMRATMFGHDVHRFDLEAYMAANATPSPPGNATPPLGNAAVPPPPAEDRSYPRAEPPRTYETRTPYEARHPVDSVPRPVGSGSQSGSSQLADFLRRQAERPNPAAFRMSSLDDTDAYPSPRVPMSAGIVLVAGLAALTIAVVFWIRSRSNPDLTVMPPPPVVAPSPAPSGFYRPTAIPPAPRGADDTSQRRLPAGTATGLPSETTPTLPAVPTPLPRTTAPALPAIPAAPLPGETASPSRRASTTPVAPPKTVRRTRVATAPRPADAPATEADGETAAKSADDKSTAGPERGAATRNESSEKPSSEKARDKRPVEKDNDATLPPSAE